MAASQFHVPVDEACHGKASSTSSFRNCKRYKKVGAAIRGATEIVKTARTDREEKTMLTLKSLLIIAGLVLFGSTGALLAYDVYLSAQLRRLLDGALSKKSRVSAAPARRTVPPHRFVLMARGAERGIRR
jgi:hypothetical protein